MSLASSWPDTNTKLGKQNNVKHRTTATALINFNTGLLGLVLQMACHSFLWVPSSPSLAELSHLMTYPLLFEFWRLTATWQLFLLLFTKIIDDLWPFPIKNIAAST